MTVRCHHVVLGGKLWDAVARQRIQNVTLETPPVGTPQTDLGFRVNLRTTFTLLCC